MKLTEWMEQKRKTQAELAEVIGRNKTRASRIYNGAIPNEEEMPLIAQWTLGDVQPNDFYDIALPDAGRREAEHRNT